MQQITLSGAALATSCLGMGCASLGSRIAPKQGLSALARAHAAGVLWYDVAPAYGGGQAEELLGQFLKGRRDTVHICTKVGLVPPKSSSLKQMVRSIARPIVGAAAPIRGLIRKSGATANRSVKLTPELLKTSLERSLSRLGTDRVESYALHNVQTEDLHRDDIRRALEDLLTQGKCRALAVAGTAEVARVALEIGAPFSILQFAQPTSTDPASALFARADEQGASCITHSIFGVSGQLDMLNKRLKADKAGAAKLADAGFGTGTAAAARLLIARARAANPNGVILASMFSERSLSANLEAAKFCSLSGRDGTGR